MGILAWIIFGALAGWAATAIIGAKDRGCVTNVIIGVVGALVGGLLMQFITGINFNFAFDLRSFAVAVLGAVVLLALTGAARKR